MIMIHIATIIATPLGPLCRTFFSRRPQLELRVRPLGAACACARACVWVQFETWTFHMDTTSHGWRGPSLELGGEAR